MSAEAAWEWFQILLWTRMMRRLHRTEREYPEYIDLGGEG